MTNGVGARDSNVRDPVTPFADRLAALVEERRSQVVLGLDPDPGRLWPQALAGTDHEARDERGGDEIAALTAAVVARHCELVIEAAGAHCVAVKPQLACFERLGAPGWSGLQTVVRAAHAAGLLVIADGKRGDVPVTAAAYAQGLVGSVEGPFGRVSGLGSDAFTANPLLGRDSLEPLLAAAAEAGAGCFILVNTSNPGAADIQDLESDSGPVREHLAGMVDELGRDSIGVCGLSSVGAVVGATRPERLGRMRELMPRAIFLLPGAGAQGGSGADLAAAFAPHPAAGLVAASRSIVDAGSGTDDLAGAAEAAAEALKETVWSLTEPR